MKKSLASLFLFAVCFSTQLPAFADELPAQSSSIAVPKTSISIEIPSFEVPTIEIPSFEVPSVEIPSVASYIPGDSILTSDEMPDTYLITYAIHSSNSTSSSGSVTTHTVGRDAEGRIYIANSDEAHLFVPESGFYAESGSSRMYTKEDLFSLCEASTSCLRKSTYILSADPEMIGTEVISGRTASVYQLTHDIGIYKQTFKLAIDDETGLCLQLENISEFLGFSAEEKLEFTCTQFMTENIILPGTEN